MRILGIDTATKFLSIGIYDNGKACEYNLEAGKLLSSLINPTIKRVLDACRLQINDIDYFACGLGPGSFTGIRIGVASIKAMSWAMKKPIAGVSTLDILAKGVKNSGSSIAVVMDAKRNLCYCGLYKKKDGLLVKTGPYKLIDKEKLAKLIPKGSIILGDALALYKDYLSANVKNITFLDKDSWYPKAHNLIELAVQKIEDKRLGNAFNTRPIYLYPKECQIKK